MNKKPDGFSWTYVLAMITLIIWGIAASRWVENLAVVYGFAIVGPFMSGSLVKFLITRVDALHEPDKDFPVWFYYVMFGLIGVLLYLVFSIIVLENVAWYMRTIVWFSALYILGWANPLVKIQPASQRHNGDGG